jgi:NitT/TauT family transport system ATP-binding protein
MELELRQVSQTFPLKKGNLVVLEDINLAIAPQEFISLVGASGCGKSTLLNLIAGLLRPSSGQILQQGIPITGPSAQRGMVFQSYTLFPWLNVAQNIAFGLQLRALPKREIQQQVEQYLEIVGLTTFRDSYPKQLSGGMQQRVAIARALINQPRVLLLDEPFAALDAQTRGLLQDFLRQLWQAQPLTVVLVTHDVSEAIYLGEKIYVLASRPGRIVQTITPQLPSLRSYQIRQDPVFLAAQSEILEQLRVEALKVFSS